MRNYVKMISTVSGPEFLFFDDAIAEERERMKTQIDAFMLLNRGKIPLASLARRALAPLDRMHVIGMSTSSIKSRRDGETVDEAELRCADCGNKIGYGRRFMIRDPDPDEPIVAHIVCGMLAEPGILEFYSKQESERERERERAATNSS